MTKIIFICGLLLLIQGDFAQGACPHATFQRKHLCALPESVANALKCSNERNKFDPTGKNTVFFGTSPYRQISATQCINTVGQPAYECNLTTQRCVKKGSSCKAPHHPVTGHLDYNVLAC